MTTNFLSYQTMLTNFSGFGCENSIHIWWGEKEELSIKLNDDTTISSSSYLEYCIIPVQLRTQGGLGSGFRALIDLRTREENWDHCDSNQPYHHQNKSFQSSHDLKFHHLISTFTFLHWSCYLNCTSGLFRSQWLARHLPWVYERAVDFSAKSM